MRAIAVAVPVPGLGALTYTVPDEMPMPARRRARPRPPRQPHRDRDRAGGQTGSAEARGQTAGRRGVTLGQVLPTSQRRPVDRRASRLALTSAVSAKPIIDALDSEPFLPADVVDLASWVADYYACGVGEAIATAMPPRAWIESERHAAITEAGEARMLVERGARREVLELLTGGRVVSVGALAKKTPGRRRRSSRASRRTA